MNLNFLYCFDDNFNKQALTSMNSVLNKVSSKVILNIIHNDVDNFKPIFNSSIKSEKLEKVNFYNFDKKERELPPIKTHISEATYYRLFMTDFISQDIENIIYLDADIICVNDPINILKETLMKIKSQKKSLAAAVELKREMNAEMFQKLNLINNTYFNAGVLVIDYQRWLDENISDHLLKIMDKRFEQIEDYDQEILNIYFDDDFVKIDRNLNFQAIGGNAQEVEKIKENVFFLHYLGKNKPWAAESIPNPTSLFYQDEYRKLNIGKYHITFNRNFSSIKKYLKTIGSFKFLSLDYPFNYLFWSLTKLFFNK